MAITIPATSYVDIDSSTTNTSSFMRFAIVTSLVCQDLSTNQAMCFDQTGGMGPSVRLNNPTNAPQTHYVRFDSDVLSFSWGQDQLMFTFNLRPI